MIPLYQGHFVPTFLYKSSQPSPPPLCYHRAARLRTSDPAHLEALSQLAACAGFDVISRPGGQAYVEVFVKKQDGHFTAYEQFLSSQLLRVDSPTFHDLEYDYPEELKNEVRAGCSPFI